MRGCFLSLVLCSGLALAQSSPPGQVTWSGSIRTRVEIWDFFKGAADSTYAFSGSTLRFGATRQTKPLDWQLEFEAPVLSGLPGNSVASGAQGQLGLGAAYFIANKRSRNAAMPFAKQAYVRFKNLGREGRQSLRIGRLEFADGAEMTPKNGTLAAVKRDRVANRLLGTFGFTHVGRSFDGVHYSYIGPRGNFTFLGAAPTRGVFQVDGWGPLPIGVLYGAYTRAAPAPKGAAEFRMFGIYYHDWRAVLKTDNRPLAVRRDDSDSVRLATMGGHYLRAWESKAGTADLMFWGVIQSGRWGRQVQRAGAASLEAGCQPTVWKAVKPWFRGGVHHGSGDADPNDNTHGTFFQLLPTPRLLARFPFYNLMNNQEAFGEVILRPHARLTIRSQAHWVRLAEAADLWYQGGGPFQPWTFGYVGRASGGSRGLARVIDLSADSQINSHASVSAYIAHARGAGIIQSIYPDGKNAIFGYVELVYRF